MWIEAGEDKTKAVIVMCTSDGLQTHSFKGAHWFLHEATDRTWLTRRTEASTYEVSKARLLLHPATQGLLIDRILNSSVVEEMALRREGEDEFYVTLWLRDPDPLIPVSDTPPLVGPDIGKLLCCALLEVLSVEAAIKPGAPSV